MRTLALTTSFLALALALAGCGRSVPLPAERNGGASNRDSLTSPRSTGSCTLAGAVIQRGDGSYRYCSTEAGVDRTCRFAPELGEYVQLNIYSNRGKPTVGVDYSQAFGGTGRTFDQAAALPPLTVSDGSDGRTNCDRAVIYGLDPDDGSQIGCTITLIRISQSGCTASKAN